MDHSRWFESTFHELTGQGLWLRGGELNTLSPDQFAPAALRVLFYRLSTYQDVAHSFTHRLLYQIAAGTPGVFPDLGYLPPKGDLSIFRRDRIAWMLGTQTKRDVSEFDLLAISNSIVQELINLPQALLASGVPLSLKERLARRDLPLVLLGGANALYSSAVTLGDPLVDGVFVGEDPRVIRQLLALCKEAKRAGLEKQEQLERLEAEIPGFFRPASEARSRKSFIPNLNQAEALEKAPVPFNAETLGSSQLQISEGCPCFCSFCAESWDRKPYREREAGHLLESALRAKAAMGLDSIDLFSFNFNMHSGVYRLFWDLVPRFRNIGMMSQRFDLLAHDLSMVGFQHAVGKSNFTCGLEGISQRLRNYLHKNLESPDIHRSVEAIFKSKARELKVFVIATGLEEDQDYTAFTDLLEHLKKIRTASHASTRVIFSMTPLVRFPWTPLEFETAPSMARVERVLEQTARRVRNAGFEFRESANLPEYWVSQVLIRASDPKITRALLRALAETGFVYYTELPESFSTALRRQLEQEGLGEPELLGGSALEESHTRPWARMETGVKREFLWEEYERARKFEEIDYCLGRSWEKAHCFHCGGCPTRHHVRDIVLATQKRSYNLEQLKARVRQVREAEVELQLRVQVGKAGIGISRKAVGVALARALMLVKPELREKYRGYRGSFWDLEDRACWIAGAEVLKLGWDRTAQPLIGSLLADPSTLALVNSELGHWAAMDGDALVGASTDLRPARIEFCSPHGCSPDRWLQELGLKYTLKKAENQRYHYELTEASRKKGWVQELIRSDEPSGQSLCTLTPGPKLTAAEVHSFLERAFRPRSPSMAVGAWWVQTQVRCL